jgi:hypothetical protein
MAYTSILKLAQPVTGSEDGTWGETVNNAITEPIEEAIAGTVTVAHTDAASITLSDGDGSAANQSRYMFINVTGALTANREVICPAASKLYFVANNTTGGFPITFTTASGLGVFVAPGKKAALYCDGTNVVYAFDQVALKPTAYIAGDMGNDTTDYAVAAIPTVQSNVTTAANIFYTAPSLEAASFNLASLRHFYATQGDFGVGSTVSAQIGYDVDASLTGAQYNIGFNSGLVAQSSVAITSTSGTGLTATVESAASHGLVNGDQVFITGTSVPGYIGGPYTVTIVDSNTFTYISNATGSSTGGYSTKTNDWCFYGLTAPSSFNGPVVIDAFSEMDGLRITQRGGGNALVVEDSTNPDATPVVVDSTGQVIMGNTVPVTSVSLTPKLQVQGTDTSRSSALAAGFANDATTNGIMHLAKSRGSLGNIGTAVQSGDRVGSIYFAGDDGTALIRAAQIMAEVDGTPGTNDMPGRLVFMTTADGASIPTERFRMNSAGALGISGANFGSAGQVMTSAGSASAPAWQTQTVSISFVIDYAGAVITTGVKGDLTIPFGCTITEWTLLADTTGSIVIDVWKDTYANYPPTVADTITGSALPTISSGIKGQSSTLTGWTTAIAANDILRFNVNSCSTITRVTLSLKVTKT